MTGNGRQRFSKLAPLDLDQRILLSTLAINFFAPLAYKKMCEVIGKVADPKTTRPLTGRDFLSYLGKSNHFEEPDRYLFRIRDLLSQLVRSF